jgi:hypothetical protein
VSDVAAALGIMTGVDAADAATKKSEGVLQADYTKDLRADALKGARSGIARRHDDKIPGRQLQARVLDSREGHGRCALGRTAANSPRRNPVNAA